MPSEANGPEHLPADWSDAFPASPHRLLRQLIDAGFSRADVAWILDLSDRGTAAEAAIAGPREAERPER